MYYNVLILDILLYIYFSSYLFKRNTFDCKRMSQSKKTYTLGKIKQLVDLNGDSTNFDLSFKVTCQDNTPFNLLVVDQTTLDNTPELQYKEVHNTISGNIVADKNIYQNYFMILKSEKPCLVDVELTKKVLPKTPDVSLGDIGGMPINTSPNLHGSGNKPYGHGDPPPSSINWKKIGLIALVIVIGFGVLWWLYKKKKNDSGETLSPIKHNYTLNETDGENLSPVHTSPIPVKNITPVLYSSSNHGYKSSYKPGPSVSYKSTVSPDIMSQASHQSSSRSDGGSNSLLHRLRKFAR
jgi:hypothetical protein